MSRRADIIQRIMRRIRLEDRGHGSPCWVWQGPTSGNGRGGGYPRMCLNNVTCAVHKVVFSHFHGYIPPTKQIDHNCNVRSCVNPEHLELMTHKKNQKLRAQRARGVK